MSDRLRPRRGRLPLAVLGVAVVGMLGGHELGYLLGGAARTLSTPHGHLDATVHAAPVLAAWSLLAAALTDPRRGWTRELTVPRLTAVQTTLFVLVEVGERALQGAAFGELSSASVLLGLLAQPLLAALTVLLARYGQTVVGHLLRRRRAGRPVALGPVLGTAGTPVLVSRQPPSVSSRDPPRDVRSAPHVPPRTPTRPRARGDGRTRWIAHDPGWSQACSRPA